MKVKNKIKQKILIGCFTLLLCFNGAAGAAFGTVTEDVTADVPALATETNEDLPADEGTGEDTVVPEDEPVIEEPVIDEPVIDGSDDQQGDEPVIEDPSVDEPVIGGDDPDAYIEDDEQYVDDSGIDEQTVDTYDDYYQEDPYVEDETADGDAAAAEIDTRLFSLYIACGEMVPAFSSDVFEYTVYVTEDQENKDCTLYYGPADSTVTITEEGEETFTNTNVERKVIVEGANGEKSEYVITVHVLKSNELLENNILYTMQEKPDLDALPKGFDDDKAEYKGKEINVAKSEDGKLCLIQFVNAKDKEDTKWYYLDEKKQELSAAEFVKLDKGDFVVVPSEKNVVYGKGGKGVGYYAYDAEKKQLGEYKGDGVDKEEKKKSSKITFSPAAIALLLVLAFVACVIIFFFRQKRAAAKALEESMGENKYFKEHFYLDDSHDFDKDIILEDLVMQWEIKKAFIPYPLVLYARIVREKLAAQAEAEEAQKAVEADEAESPASAVTAEPAVSKDDAVKDEEKKPE